MNEDCIMYSVCVGLACCLFDIVFILIYNDDISCT